MTTHFSPLLPLFALAVGLTACGSKDKATTKSTEAAPTTTQQDNSPTQMLATTHDNKDNPTLLAGHNYVWTSSRTPDDSQAPISIRGRQYTDNSIRLNVSTGGNTIFDRTFKKADFASYLTPEFAQHGLLINLVGAGAEGDKLRFIATIGYPDGIDDEAFQSISLLITPSGEITLSATNTQELDNLEGPTHEDEGV